jgi:hypothetical protein
MLQVKAPDLNHVRVSYYVTMFCLYDDPLAGELTKFDLSFTESCRYYTAQL